MVGQKCCGVKSILGGNKIIRGLEFLETNCWGQDIGGAEMESGFLCPL